MICPGCGRELQEGAEFCPFCGTKIKQDETTQITNNEVTNIQETSNTETPVVNTTPIVNTMEQVNVSNQFENTISPVETNTPVESVTSPEITTPEVQSVEEVQTPPQVDNAPSEKKPIDKKLFIIIGVIALILIIVICLLLFNKKSNKQEEVLDLSQSTAFLFKNDEDKYAVISEDGDKLSDFIYDYAGSFLNGFAVVKKDGEYGVINSKGKTTINFGTYKYISREGCLFDVEDEEYNHYLVDGNGKLISDLKDESHSDFSTIDEFTVLKNKKTKKVSILDYNGKEIFNIPMVNEDDEVSADLEGNMAVVFYNKKNYYFNIKTLKLITTLDANNTFCISYTTEDGSASLLRSCSSWYDYSETKDEYRILKDNKIYDFSDKCDSIYLSDNDFSCVKDEAEYLFDSQFNITTNNIRKSQYIDSSNYIVMSDDDKSVDFYNNGKLIKSVECRSFNKDKKANQGMYVLYNTYGNGCEYTGSTYYEYYDSKGDKAIDTQFERADSFDENGNAIVSLGTEKSRYTSALINKTGKVISPENNYYSISYSSDTKKYLYSKYDEDYNRYLGLAAADGSLLYDVKYSSIEVEKVKDKEIITYKIDGKTTVYNQSDKKEIVTSDGIVSTYSNYVLVAEANSNKYYTYNGKLFYEGKY